MSELEISLDDELLKKLEKLSSIYNLKINSIVVEFIENGIAKFSDIL